MIGTHWKTAGAFVLCGSFLGIGQAHAGSIAIQDHSFEQKTGTLSNGFLGIGAESQKQIGGWTYSRSSLLGLLPPNMGSYASGNATDGNNIASISALATVAGHGYISQTLSGQYFEANTKYLLKVDVSDAGLAEILSSGPGIALTSGGDVVAASSQPSLLTVLDLNAHFKTWVLCFITGDTAPVGEIGIKLFSGELADVAGVVSFDNVRLDSEPAHAVPTPTAAVMGLAGLTLVGLRRRLNLCDATR